MDLPPPVIAGQFGEVPTGGTVVKAAWNALKNDRQLLVIPVMSGLVSLLAVAPLVGAYFLAGQTSAAQYILGALGLFALSLVSTFFAVALASAAHVRMNGGTPTLAAAMHLAWRRRGAVVGWALMSTVVALVLNLIAERLKLGGVIMRWIGDIAWTLATYFAIPIIAANDVGAIEALKLSARTFKQRWGKAVRLEFRLGMIGVIFSLGLVVAGAITVLCFLTSMVLGVAALVATVLVFIAGAVTLSALGTYTRVALYRFSVGLPVGAFDVTAFKALVMPAKTKSGSFFG